LRFWQADERFVLYKRAGKYTELILKSIGESVGNCAPRTLDEVGADEHLRLLTGKQTLMARHPRNVCARHGAVGSKATLQPPYRKKKKQAGLRARRMLLRATRSKKFPDTPSRSVSSRWKLSNMEVYAGLGVRESGE